MVALGATVLEPGSIPGASTKYASWHGVKTVFVQICHNEIWKAFLLLWSCGFQRKRDDSFSRQK